MNYNSSALITCSKVTFCKPYFLPLLLALFCGGILSAQETEAPNSKGSSKFSLGVEFGVSLPTILGAPSLEIEGFPSAAEAVQNKKELNTFREEKIAARPYLGFGLYYAIKPRLSIGIQTQWRSDYKYAAYQFYWQDKLVISNNLQVTSRGSFKQESKISSTQLGLVANYSVFSSQFTSTTQIEFQVGAGAGLSFFRHQTSVPYVFLNMTVANFEVSGDYTLGPGDIAAVTQKNNSFYWQFNGGFKFTNTAFPDLKVGFRYINQGKFILKEQPASSQELVVLSATNSGSQDENLILKATNSERTLRSLDIYIQVFLW